MRFLRQVFNAKPGERIIVEFSKPTKILFIHGSQFNNYKGGKTYRYYGGFKKESPAEFDVPFEGVWYAIIEKGTYTQPLEVTGKARLTKIPHRTLNGAEQMETHKKLEEQYDDTFE